MSEVEVHFLEGGGNKPSSGITMVIAKLFSRRLSRLFKYVLHSNVLNCLNYDVQISSMWFHRIQTSKCWLLNKENLIDVCLKLSLYICIYLFLKIFVLTYTIRSHKIIWSFFYFILQTNVLFSSWKKLYFLDWMNILNKLLNHTKVFSDNRLLKMYVNIIHNYFHNDA